MICLKNSRIFFARIFANLLNEPVVVREKKWWEKKPAAELRLLFKLALPTMLQMVYGPRWAVGPSRGKRRSAPVQPFGACWPTSKLAPVFSGSELSRVLGWESVWLSCTPSGQSRWNGDQRPENLENKNCLQRSQNTILKRTSKGLPVWCSVICRQSRRSKIPAVWCRETRLWHFWKRLKNVSNHVEKSIK